MSGDNIDISYNHIDDSSLDEAAEEIQYMSLLYINKKRELQLTNLKQNIHDVLFENQEQIPDGIYLQIMNIIKKY